MFVGQVVKGPWKSLTHFDFQKQRRSESPCLWTRGATPFAARLGNTNFSIALHKLAKPSEAPLFRVIMALPTTTGTFPSLMGCLDAWYLNGGGPCLVPCLVIVMMMLLP
jgi:hypothetical protein